MILSKRNISRSLAVVLTAGLFFQTSCTSSTFKKHLKLDSNAISYNCYNKQKLIIKGVVEVDKLAPTPNYRADRLPKKQSQQLSTLIIKSSLPLNYQRKLRTGKALTIELNNQLYKGNITAVKVDGFKNKIDFSLAINTSTKTQYKDGATVAFELKPLSPELISGLPLGNASLQSHSAMNTHR
ncbi:hypothetical protein [Carboxylicivirga taeanensis]|uniref:hypothetical protein n=1 Tax=Carboxylicivirga taeanensis TaxID=1416875 RepID=UPI003F6DD230